MFSRPLRRIFPLAAALLMAVSARAQLAALSPFLPPAGARDTGVPTNNAPLEYRGVADLPGGESFRVVDPARKTGVWVRLNERDSELGIVVKQHDPENETVVVEQQGRTFTLQLHQAKVTSAGAPMGPSVAINTVMAMNATPQLAFAQGARPAVPLQQQQLDAVAAAVAQRRALREQAQQQIGQGVPVTPQAIQAQRGQNAQNVPAQNQGGQRGEQRNRPQP